jgi:DNA polymerase III delta prime subunit
MRLGDLLLRANLINEDQLTTALEYQGATGGRLGDALIATNALTQKQMDHFIHRTPTEPEKLSAIDIDKSELLGLMMKLIYIGRLESGRQFENALKLPFHIVLELIRLAIDRKLLYTKGLRSADNMSDMNYAMTEEGQRIANDALERSRYVGPAPVTLEEFTYQVNLQKLTNEVISFDRIRTQMGSLIVDESIVEQAGPALNSGRAMLLYGPPGNGKTTFAMRLANVFTDMIYVPYAVIVEGQIIRFFDASLHIPGKVEAKDAATPSFIRENYDARWIPIKRPFVIAGGELTLEMLDLRYDSVSRTYEAPLHMKALGGCFVIDDFGRQLVSPTHLLNRWIVPLESRMDFLKLHTGKSFSIPFEQLVMFSTNLEPEDLMDQAFLRRLPYKIEVGAPSTERYKAIFAQEATRQGMELSDETFDLIHHKITVEKQLELAAYQPKFIIDQVVATCRFMGQPSHFEPRFIDYAIDNLRVKSKIPRLRRAEDPKP